MPIELKMVAIAPYDGWAFVQEDEALFLVRPPYTISSKIRCEPTELEDAVQKHGFFSTNQSFSNYAELIHFIKNKSIEAHKENGEALPTIEELKELLDDAPEYILQTFLDRAENLLIPEGKIEVAEAIALDLLKLEAVRENKKLHSQAIRIFDKCKESKKRKSAWEDSIQEKRWRDKYTHIFDRYTFENIRQASNATRASQIVFALS